MDRRNVSKALFASMAGSLALPQVAAAQSSCTAPCYAQTQDEIDAGITPVNYAYAPGDVRRYGGVFNGSTDDTNAWNAAIRALGARGGVVWGAPGAISHIAQPNGILLTPHVTIDLCGGTLVGTGNANGGNVGIQTATYISGVPTPNFGQITRHCPSPQVRNGQLFRFGTALMLTAAIDSSSFTNLQLYECYRGVYATFCLYARFDNIMYRNTSPAYGFRFSNNCNAITLRNCYAVGSNPGTVAVGFLFDAKTYAVKLLNCSAEFCDKGIQTEEVHGFDLDGCYFEGITNIALDLNSSFFRKIGVRLSSCFFASTPRLIYGRTVNNFVWEASNERFADCIPGTIDLQADTSIPSGDLSVCTGVIRLASTDLLASSAGPADARLPSWLLLTNGMDVDANFAIARDGGYANPVVAKAKLTAAPAAFYYSGAGAAINAGDQVRPFQTVNFSGGATFSVIIDTAINFYDYNFLIFRLDIADNLNQHKILGRAYGTDVFLDQGSGKTVSVSNNAGYVRLTVSSFSHPSGSAAVTSVVRHV